MVPEPRHEGLWILEDAWFVTASHLPVTRFQGFYAFSGPRQEPALPYLQGLTLLNSFGSSRAFTQWLSKFSHRALQNCQYKLVVIEENPPFLPEQLLPIRGSVEDNYSECFQEFVCYVYP